ncbi:NAD(P)-dependent alcohol dehydrogenase [Cyclobacterium qasimii]|uniref:NADPH:quinone reductase n=2 Tax=Cyclobacterium qasimii TaxID=1350429 RepID=A0A512C815_9BACT|nr:NAD(P)-dependent alcohol dehydrogenase [Cyclobacterium qasimii]EPR67718.1 putative zinc-binding oxidoreductase [Cyclobacterium qasimii M12-11B]GEO20323.1 NADPH:quinone reductase [Cyclobacterium qasimii]
MKVLIFERYGLPEKVLKLSEQVTPVPKDNEILVKVHCTAINDYDWSLVRGKPFLYRLMFGLTKPKSKIMGMELSGTVVQVGAEVQDFAVGDEVFGDISNYGFGTFAAYISINAKALVRKPKSMSFESAAALPHASLLALQGLRDIGKIKKGMKVLINGAGGGVGTLALQLAKIYACEVTGVDNREKLAMLRALGYDHVIDYKVEDFTKNGLQYDLILDCKTNKSPFSYHRSLKPEGNYVSIGGNLIDLITTLIWGKLLQPFSNKKLNILSLKPNAGLEEIAGLYAKKQLKPVIDGPYPLESAAEKLQLFGEGKHIGKVIITIHP